MKPLVIWSDKRSVLREISFSSRYGTVERERTSSVVMEQLNQEFLNSGYDGIPRGLRYVLRRIPVKPKGKSNETPDECRNQAYHRIFGILWYGNQVGRGKFQGKAKPTYVYPEVLKEAIREMIEGGVKDYNNPQGAGVYKVTIQDLQEAKWPSQK